MPYTEKQEHIPLIKTSRELSLITAKQKIDWQPKTAQIKARQQMGFQSLSDKLSGGLQYWYKQKHSGTIKHYKDYISTNRKMGERIFRDGRCQDCGGFVNGESKFRLYLDDKTYEPKCGFGRQYCDVIGPCADCSLLNQRNAILHRQGVEFPDIEVTPRRLVAPLLAQAMLETTNKDSSSIELYRPTSPFYKLPIISPETLRYMRRATGSSSQRKTLVSSEQDTIKKYIEVRLPKI